MRLLFNIIFFTILSVGLVGFWILFLNLWKPKKKWPAWIGYILIIGGWLAAVVYYMMYQADLFGTQYYPLMNLFRTESYGFLMGLFLAIPVFILLGILYWIVNKIFDKTPEENRTGRRAFFRTAATLVPLATVGGSSYAAFAGQHEIVVTHESFGYTNLPEGLKNYKIVQLSDIHIGLCIDLDDFDEILKMALIEKPNRVVITGDLIDRLDWLPQVCERRCRLHSGQS